MSASPKHLHHLLLIQKEAYAKWRGPGTTSYLRKLTEKCLSERQEENNPRADPNKCTIQTERLSLSIRPVCYFLTVHLNLTVPKTLHCLAWILFRTLIRVVSVYCILIFRCRGRVKGAGRSFHTESPNFFPSQVLQRQQPQKWDITKLDQI